MFEEIWFKCNIVVHSGEFLNPNFVVRGQGVTWMSSRRQMQKTIKGQHSMGKSIYSHGKLLQEPVGMQKVNWGVAVATNGWLGMGIIVRDQEGYVRHCSAKPDKIGKFRTYRS
jgi:hypothetical protein